jgi:predicted small secreted protein
MLTTLYRQKFLKGGEMKKLIIICAALVMLSTPLFAADNTTGTGQEGDAASAEIEQQVRIIKEIHTDSFVFGRDVFQISENIEYYSENGRRVTKTHFEEKDGVLIKLINNKIVYMKKMPY